MKRSEEKLSAANIRVNAHRMTLLHILLTEKGHPTARILHHRMKEVFPRITLATVYNTINILKERELIYAVADNEKEDRYDAYNDGHGHFICDRCGSLTDIPARFCGDILPPPVMDGHRALRKQVIFYGVCKDCIKPGLPGQETGS
jgi:Fur family peroxide stress response transcriptional regulator